MRDINFLYTYCACIMNRDNKWYPPDTSLVEDEENIKVNFWGLFHTQSDKCNIDIYILFYLLKTLTSVITQIAYL